MTDRINHRLFTFTKLQCFAVVFFSIMAANVYAALPAGSVDAVNGDGVAKAQAPGQSLRELVEGDEVFSGDRIQTDAKVSLLIRFTDGTEFEIAPDTEMIIDQFSFNQTKQEDAFHTRILKGAFRFISGLIAKQGPDTMNVNISVATLGIRGTQVMGEVNARSEKDGKVIEASARVMLLEPEQEDVATSILVANQYGSVVVDQPGYGTEIPDEHSPPSPVRKMQLNTINNVLRALRSSSRRINTPRPRP